MKNPILPAILGLLAAATALSQTPEAAPPAHTAAAAKSSPEAWAQSNLQGWPPRTVTLGVELVKKYGPPNETASRQITWFHNGAWKRTVLWRDGVKHNFPKAHEDVLEQTVDYKVPADKVADLLTYNGSLVVDRTRGELSVHCDSEKQKHAHSQHRRRHRKRRAQRRAGAGVSRTGDRRNARWRSGALPVETALQTAGRERPERGRGRGSSAAGAPRRLSHGLMTRKWMAFEAP